MTRPWWIALLLAVSCGSSQRAAPPPATAQPQAGPAAPAPPPTPAAAGSEQTFAAADQGLAFLDPDRRKKLEAAFPDLDKAIAEEIATQGLPGVAVGVVIDGDLAYSKGYGTTTLGKDLVPDADTVYRIGSITKSFTGLALLALRDDGKLDLDDTLAHWIPEASGLIYPSHDTRPITLRQLATHTSGLPRMGTFDPEHGPSEDAIVASLAGLALDNAPGAVHVYSNLGFSLLGIIVGRAAHAPLHDVIAAKLLAPLGMTSTVWAAADVPAGVLAPAYTNDPAKPTETTPDDLGAADGAGGIYSSIRDMARYAAFQLAAYPPRNDPDTGAIRRATVREAHSTGFHSDGNGVRLAPAPARGEPLADFDATTYGFGWVQDENCAFDDRIWHNGAIDSYRSDLHFLPARGVAVIVLTNFGQGNTHAIATRMLEVLAKTGALTKRAAALSPAFDPAMTEFLAVYNNWDDKAYAAMLDPARGAVAVEKDELAGYKALHGTCSGFTAKDVHSASEAVFAVTCERGDFELLLLISPKSGKITGFLGTSRNVTGPAPMLAKAKAVAQLIAKYDAAAATKLFAHTKLAAELIRTTTDGLHAAHGACRVREAVHSGFDWIVELTCDRGGDLAMSLKLDGKNNITGIRVVPAGDGRGGCPTR
jgi:CubicO group peptidase (beta-lactamase class C family)